MQNQKKKSTDPQQNACIFINLQARPCFFPGEKTKQNKKKKKQKKKRFSYLHVSGNTAFFTPYFFKSVLIMNEDSVLELYFRILLRCCHIYSINCILIKEDIKYHSGLPRLYRNYFVHDPYHVKTWHREKCGQWRRSLIKPFAVRLPNRSA